MYSHETDLNIPALFGWCKLMKRKEDNHPRDRKCFPFVRHDLEGQMLYWNTRLKLWVIFYEFEMFKVISLRSFDLKLPRRSEVNKGQRLLTCQEKFGFLFGRLWNSKANWSPYVYHDKTSHIGSLILINEDIKNLRS